MFSEARFLYSVAGGFVFLGIINDPERTLPEYTPQPGQRFNNS